jgi:hypothetical protein
MESFRSSQELPMQAVVARVMRALSVKQSSDEVARRGATEFAAELLDNYRTLLAQRDRSPRAH